MARRGIERLGFARVYHRLRHFAEYELHGVNAERTRPAVSKAEPKVEPIPIDARETRCPYCAKVNPQIRRVPAFTDLVGGNVGAVIFSCAHCKRILSLQQVTLGPEPDPKAA